MNKIAIKFENISKQYRLGTIGTGTISHDLKRWWVVSVLGKEDPYLKIGQLNDRSVKADGNLVWALKDINFEVNQGEVLGIIGKNGAGKSTLLKILSRVTTPTTGRITAYGRLASLLEVGTGFHPEMTGRENIFMNGSIMGMTKAEIRNKFDEIVEFSGVSKYIDTPVKRYSTGMTVRLGFAIAAHLEPDILVVDEVLAVGDAEFQKKAVGKMRDASSKEGRTVLFVSHNMGVISTLCQKVVLLKDGYISAMGETNQMISEFLKISSTNNGKSYDNTKPKPNQKLKIRQVSVLDKDRKVSSELKNTESGYIEVIYEVFKEGNGYNVGIELFHAQYGCIFSSSLKDTDVHGFISFNQKVGVYRYLIPLPMDFLRGGDYWIAVASSIPKVEVLDEFQYETKFLLLDIKSPVALSLEGRRGCVLPSLKWIKE